MQKESTTAKFSNIIEFRQAVYEHGFTRARDAQFELVDAALSGQYIQSFPELSLAPVFRRAWPSVYAAIEEGHQNRAWLEQQFVAQVPRKGPQIFPLDESAWVHSAAKVLADRQYIHGSTRAVKSSIVIGHSYSMLAWVPRAHTSWALPLSTRRVSSQQTATDVGVAQVKQLCRQREKEMQKTLYLIIGDGKYGNQHFLGALKSEPCGALVRLRRDRVLYGRPGPYRGRGRPRVHGKRFAFQEPKSWGDPDAETTLEDERWGSVRIRRWDHLHAGQDSTTSFSVLLVQTHRERACPAAPFWLGYQLPPHQDPGDQELVELWRWYDWRWPIEPGFRFRKQQLHWTLPRFQTPERCDRWTMLVSVAQWELFLARDIVADQPLPWQPAQDNLTPERTLQSMGMIFPALGSPAHAPQPRGKSPGWPKGRSRTRLKRHRVVKKR